MRLPPPGSLEFPPVILSTTFPTVTSRPCREWGMQLARFSMVLTGNAGTLVAWSKLNSTQP